MLLAHLGRRLAEHDAASQLAVHPTWAVVLDQEAELIARLDDAILQVAVDDLARLPRRPGEGKKQTLLAAERVPNLLGDRGNIELAHPGLDGRKRGTHRLVL